MFLKKIFLSNFRNYKHFSIEVSPYINIIKGENASGKTNLIDAIYFLLNSHSFIKRKSLPNTKSKISILRGIIVNDITYNVIISINKEKKSTINSKRHNIKDFKILFPTIIYSIKDFIEFSDKKYILSLIDKFSFITNNEILDYLINIQRQIRIKKYLLTKNDIIGIRIINKKIIELMQSIQTNRQSSIKNLNEILNSQEILPKKITIHYKPIFLTQDKIEKEISKKQSLYTPYKDCINITLDENDIFSYSSVGEKKMVLFSIIVSLIHYYNKHNVKPIVLIDDIEGDVSQSNLARILSIIQKLPNQIFITTLNGFQINNSKLINL